MGSPSSFSVKSLSLVVLLVAGLGLAISAYYGEQDTLMSEALETLVVEHDLGIAWVTIPPGSLERHGVDPDDLDGVVEYARSIEGVRLGMLFREIAGGRIKISFRSIGGVDVAKLAAQFNGGGHAKAAGASLPGAMADVQATVLKAARAYLAGH